MAEPPVISIEYQGRVAIITIANDKKLNALNQQQYFDLAQALREVATHDEVFITLLIGKGRYFSAYVSPAFFSHLLSPFLSLRSPDRACCTFARLTSPCSGADVTMGRDTPSDRSEQYKQTLQTFVAYNLNITQAFYAHPKILVVGLNGPVVGLSAALTGFADFVYAAPHAFLLTPFSSIGLVAEGGSSRGLVQRLGVAKANEALIMSKRIGVDELVATGYVNKVFDVAKGDDQGFRRLVLQEIDDRLGEHLVGDSLLGIKELIRKNERDVLDGQGAREVFAGLQRFMSGVPQEEFRKLATGQKRHKL